MKSDQSSKRKIIFCLFFDHSENDTETLPALAEACHRFTPTLAIRESEALFLDMTKSLHLFQAALFPLRLLALCRRFKLAPKISVAEDAPTALALARYGVKKKEDLPLEALADFLSPFQSLAHAPESLRKLRHWTQALRDLGIKDLEGFTELPTNTLATRLGKDGISLSQKLIFGDSTPWPFFVLPEKIVEQIDLFEADTLAPCSSLEPLLFLLKPAIDRSMARLRARSKRASQIRVEFELESGSEFKAVPNRVFRMELPVPQGAAGAILSLLKTKLESGLTRNPLQSPVVSLRFEVEKMVPGYGAQKNFFESTEDLTIEQREAWDALTARLLSELGEEGAFLAEPVDTHVPENSWKQGAVHLTGDAPKVQPIESSSALAKGLTTVKTLRPTRLLERPELIRFETYRSFVDWQGPERIETDWWSHSKEVVRDYFRVTTRGGEQLWVFQSFAQYFLHGYFD